MKFALTLLLSCIGMFGQQTYQLPGKGYVSGMSYVSRISGSMQMETKDSSAPKAGSYTFVHKVEVKDADQKTGKIIEAIVEISGDYDRQLDDNPIPAEYINTKLLYKRKWDGWDVFFGEQKITDKALEALNNVAFCEEYNTLPTFPVPIGHKWSVSVADFFRMMGNSAKEFAQIAQNASGQTKFVFQNIVKSDGNDCAQIDMDMSMKMSIPNQGSMKIKGAVREFRRLDYGIPAHSEGKMEMNGSGVKMTVSIQSSCKIIDP